jgi:hypothetical protein
VPGSKKVLKATNNNGVLLKGYRSQIKELSINGQNRFEPKKTMYNTKYKINIHESILIQIHD